MPVQYLEDFTSGQLFRSDNLRVDTDSIKRFAREFDPQPFHLEDALARDTIFGGLAASGWHTAAMTMKLLLNSEFSPAGGIIGVGFEELRWPRPVRPGDELHVEAEVVDVRPSKSNPRQGLVKLRTATVNQHGDAVQVSVGSVVVPRRNEGSATG
jgi:acyl dehydratase